MVEEKNAESFETRLTNEEKKVRVVITTEGFTDTKKARLFEETRKYEESLKKILTEE